MSEIAKLYDEVMDMATTKIRPEQIASTSVDHEALRRKDMKIIDAAYDVERIVTSRFMKAVPMGCNLSVVDTQKTIEGIGTTIEFRVKILVPCDYEPTTMEELESAVS